MSNVLVFSLLQSFRCGLVLRSQVIAAHRFVDIGPLGVAFVLIRLQPNVQRTHALDRSHATTRCPVWGGNSLGKYTPPIVGVPRRSGGANDRIRRNDLPALCESVPAR